MLERKNAFWNMIGASLNAFTSLVFVIIVSWINGQGPAGVFSFGFSCAIIFYCIANYINRPFQVTDISGKYSDSDYIYFRLFTCAFSLIPPVVYSLLNGYNLNKFLIILLLCVYRASEAFTETFYSVTQKNGFLYKVGFSMSIRAILGIGLFFAIDLLFKNLILATVSLTAVNILVFVLYDYRSAKSSGLTTTKYNKRLWTLLSIGFSNFVLTILNIFIVNVGRYAIDKYCSDTTQAIYGYILMPATVMCLLAQYIIQPVIVNISASIKEKNYLVFKKYIKNSLLLLSAVMAIVLVCAYLLEVPVLSIVYHCDLAPYKKEAMLIIFGAVFFGFETTISLVLVAMRKINVQAILFFVVTAISVIISFMPKKNTNLCTASTAYLITMVLISVSLFAVLIVNMKKYKKDWN